MDCCIQAETYPASARMYDGVSKRFPTRWSAMRSVRCANTIVGKRTPRGSPLFIKRMKTEMQDVTWAEINQAFAPFVGTPLYAIRAEAFFHLALRGGRRNLFRLKNIFYPAAVVWRSMAWTRKEKSSRANTYLFVCDYGADPGFGTLMPLLKSSNGPATLVVNSRVLAARRRELAQLGNVQTICADS